MIPISAINWDSVMAALVSSTVLAAVLGIVFKRYVETVAAEVRTGVEQQLLRYRSSMEWKVQSLAELLAPMAMQLQRTERAFKNWNGKNLFLEAKIIGEANRTIRDLLLAKGHLIPNDLLKDAHLLVEHYDRWLEKFEQVRVEKTPGNDDTFVFVGPDGFPFPRAAADRFEVRFSEEWSKLYGDSPNES